MVKEDCIQVLVCSEQPNEKLSTSFRNNILNTIRYVPVSWFERKKTFDQVKIFLYFIKHS